MSNEDIKMSDVFDGSVHLAMYEGERVLADSAYFELIEDDQLEAMAYAVNNHDPMALRIKELEAENKSLGLKNGDIVVYPECFGDKTLVFIGMAKGLDYSNDCAVICDGNAAPVRLSGLIKVEDK